MKTGIEGLIVRATMVQKGSDVLQNDHKVFTIPELEIDLHVVEWIEQNVVLLKYIGGVKTYGVDFMSPSYNQHKYYIMEIDTNYRYFNKCHVVDCIHAEPFGRKTSLKKQFVNWYKTTYKNEHK